MYARVGLKGGGMMILYKIALYIFYIFLILDIQKATDIKNILKKGFISIVINAQMMKREQNVLRYRKRYYVLIRKHSKKLIMLNISAMMMTS